MAVVTKDDVINKTVSRTGLAKSDVKDIFEFIFDLVKNELVRGEKVQFRNFGTFEVKLKKARHGVNPRTQEHIIIPAKKAIEFRVSRSMREAVNSE